MKNDAYTYAHFGTTTTQSQLMWKSSFVEIRLSPTYGTMQTDVVVVWKTPKMGVKDMQASVVTGVDGVVDVIAVAAFTIAHDTTQKTRVDRNAFRN